jgi:hypothetical protein
MAKQTRSKTARSKKMNDIHPDTMPTTATARTTTSMFANNKSSSNNDNRKATAADFDYQELKVQMNAMKQQDVKPSQLDDTKKSELQRYVRQIVAVRDSTIPLGRLKDALPNTKWRLSFSTDPAMMQSLPRDATIKLNFIDDGRVEYSLDFFKTLALKRLVASSTYTVDVSSSFVWGYLLLLSDYLDTVCGTNFIT